RARVRLRVLWHGSQVPRELEAPERFGREEELAHGRGAVEVAEQQAEPAVAGVRGHADGRGDLVIPPGALRALPVERDERREPAVGPGRRSGFETGLDRGRVPEPAQREPQLGLGDGAEDVGAATVDAYGVAD